MYLLGIDNGGSDIKCAVYDLNGKELAISRTQIPMNIPEAGFTERDVENVWEANVKVIKAVLKKAEIPGEAVVAIGVTGYGNGMVLLDEEGKPVYPAIISTDERASSYCKKFREDGTEKKIFPYTLQTTWAAQPAVLLPWFRDHKPEVLEKTKWIMSMKDYIRFRLTGKVAGEITDASSGCLVNLDTRRYDRRIFEILGIEDCYSKMPKILESTDISGYVTKEAEKMTGLPEGTPVAAGYFDIDANALASGVLSDQELCLIAGTWSINEYLSKEAPREIEKKKNTVTLSYMKDYYIMEDSTPTSASNLNWYLNHFVDIVQEQIRKKDLFARIGGDDKSVMLRAVYEGIAFSSMHHVYNLKRSLETYSKARLSGGISNSEVWSQMLCDALQIPIETLEAGEPGAKGAAMCAGVAGGVFKNLEDAVEHMVHVGKVYKPRSEYKEIYAEKFARYEAALAAVDLLTEKLQ